MEAITIAGIAALAFGGYHSICDALRDCGVTAAVKQRAEKSANSRGGAFVNQRGVQKMARLYV